MYKVEILKTANDDILDIINYILIELNNRTAALKLAEQFKNLLNYIGIFPYGFAKYKPIDKLKYEYRSMKVKNLCN